MTHPYILVESKPAGLVPPDDILLPGSKRMQKCLHLAVGKVCSLCDINTLKNTRVPVYTSSVVAEALEGLSPGKGV